MAVQSFMWTYIGIVEYFHKLLIIHSFILLFHSLLTVQNLLLAHFYFTKHNLL